MKVTPITYSYGQRELQAIASFKGRIRYSSVFRSIALVVLFVFFWFFTENKVYLCVLYSLTTLLLSLIWGLYGCKSLCLNRSVRQGRAIQKIGNVDSKYYRGDALVVDKTGSLPLLGQLFPKRWGKKMYVQPHYYVVVEGDTYIVDKDTYLWVQDKQRIQLLFTNGLGVFLNMLPV